MTGLTDAQLLTRLRALRAPPPENGFEQRLARRLQEASKARPARVISLAGWRQGKRIALALAAAALPLAAYAAASGWIPGWHVGQSEQMEPAPLRAPATKPTPGGPARSVPAPPPPKPEQTKPEDSSSHGAPPARARAVERIAPRPSRAAAPPVPPGEPEPAPAPAKTEANASGAELGTTERVRIRVGRGSVGEPASNDETVPRIRSERGDGQADGVTSRMSEREREIMERRERKGKSGWEEDRGERSGRMNEERRAKNRLRAR